MPIDQKRINGPEISVPYRLHYKTQLQDYEGRLKALLTNDIRKDGRNLNDSRKLFIKRGVITQSKGSAYVELGQTKVIVSVFDPREIPKQNKYSIHGELYCDFKFSPFACVKQRKSAQTDPDEKSLALAMKRALQPAICRHEFPNFQVDIFANVLEDGGSSLGAAITCAGLALADAGIPMYDIITAATVGVLGTKLLIDPSYEEEDLCLNSICPYEQGIITLARLATHEQISEIRQSGNLSLEIIQNSIDLLIKSNIEIVPIIQQTLVDQVVKFIKDNEENKENV